MGSEPRAASYWLEVMLLRWAGGRLGGLRLQWDGS